MLNKGHRIRIFVYIDHEYLLVAVFCFIGMIDNIKNITVFDVHDDLFKRHVTFLLQNLVLLGIPLVRNHGLAMAQCVPYGNNDSLKIDR